MSIEAQMAQVAQVPQIIVNQSGSTLINTLLDYAMKGGGLASLNTVNSVIRVINTPPQRVESQASPLPSTPKEPEGEVKC
ncbi:hypothetical protein LCGC14_0578980 [marine sediment metagenome]|uniref:Uncharacterized protein n=1 Tax=marine sediment metagenome TaxID=412755 RepID=A0A0F9RLX2_9ZZZZ